MAGPKCSTQRGKVSKHLKSGSQKKFRNDNPGALAAYAEKMSRRINRRIKKKNRKGGRQMVSAS